MIHQTTIDDTAGICTLINTFTVEAADQQRVVEQLRRFTSQVGYRPGFIAASVHASLNGERVVNYVQWETREHLEAMLATEAARRHMAEIGKLSRSVDPILCRVAFVAARPHDAP